MRLGDGEHAGSSGRSCDEAAALCARLEEAIDAGQPAASMIALFERTRRQCERIARGRSDAAQVAGRMTTAVTTWRDVWARLGRQADFRMAVAREAHHWATQFEALAKRAGAP